MNKNNRLEIIKFSLLFILLLAWMIVLWNYIRSSHTQLLFLLLFINLIFFLSVFLLRLTYSIYFSIVTFIILFIICANVFYLYRSLRIFSIFFLLNGAIYISLVIYLNDKLRAEKRSNELSIEKLSEECNVLKLEYKDFIEKKESLIIELERMKKLFQTAFLLGSSIDERETAHHLIKETVEILGIKKVLFSRWNRGDDKFYVFTQNGYINIKNKQTDNIDDWIKESKIPILINNIKNETKIKVRRYTDISNCNSIIAAPVVVADKVYGVLRAEYESPYYFTNDDLRVLDYISDLGSIVFENLYYFREIERLAITDGITGLYVHRYMLEKLKNEIQRYFRHKVSVSLIMMDIDNFKHFNDSYGHPFGDQILITVSKIIKQTIREIDFPVRYGGDEFAIILPQTELKGAKALANRLLKKFNSIDLNLLFLGREIKSDERLKVSIGVGTFKKTYKSFDKYIDRIDKALLKAKQLGKNRIEIAK